MPGVWQEFYCGECDGHIDVKLNIALNHEVEVKCPNCGHEHRRVVRNGQIFEDGRYQSSYVEKLKPVKAAYHKEPKTVRMKTKNFDARRDGAVVQSPRDLINESWFDRYGNHAHQE